MNWTPVGFGRSNGNGPTGSHFIIHGGIELELLLQISFHIPGLKPYKYKSRISIGNKTMITTGCALVWREKGKKRPQIFAKCQVVFSVAQSPMGNFVINKEVYRSE